MKSGGQRKSAGNYLTPLKSGVKRKPFLTIDIESKRGDTQEPGFTRPFLVGVYAPDILTYKSFRDEPHLASRPWRERHWSPGGCVDKALTYVLQDLFKGYNIYAHNGGNFDHLFWLKWLREHQDEYGFEVIPVQSSIQAVRVFRVPEDPEDDPVQQCTFLDSMKLFPTGLDKMLTTFGLAGKVKHDLAMHEDDPRWEEYLKQDCLGLAAGVAKIHELVEDKLGGEVGITTPATSMKLFRRRFLPKRITRHSHWPACVDRRTCDGCFHEWVRLGYYGGRTEMFETYGEGLYYRDINSSYVAAMRQDQPVGDRIIHEGYYDPRMGKHYGGLIECTVRIPDTCRIPPLPYRAKSGKLIFPVGVITGVWNHEELKLLHDETVEGEVLSVKRAVWIKKKPVFRDFVDTLWALRDKSRPGYDEGLSAMAKLLGNGSYGKFAMRMDREQVVFAKESRQGRCFLCGAEDETIAEGSICEACEGSKPAMSEADGDVWYQRKVTDACYIIPFISQHITSLARVNLWMEMKRVLVAGGRVYYCDTDSVIADVLLPSSNALGDFKDEYPGNTLRGTFVSPKVYMVEAEGEKGLKGKHKKECKSKDGESPDPECRGCAKGYVTMKGFPRSVRTPDNLKKLRAGESVKFQNLEKIRTLARLGFHRPPDMSGSLIDEHGERWLQKAFRSQYDKRILVCRKHGKEEEVITERKGRAVKITATGRFKCGCPVAFIGSSVPVKIEDWGQDEEEVA